jgi:hypothetical protein
MRDKIKREKIKTMDGEGDLYRGKSLYMRVRYHLEEWQDILAGGLRGLKDLGGRLRSADKPGDPAPFWEAFDKHELLTLHLGDGHLWDCYLSTPTGEAMGAALGLRDAAGKAN